MVAFNLTKATYSLLLMLAGLILTGNIVLIQMSLQQNEEKEAEIQLLNRRLLSVAEGVESDSVFLSVIEELPELSEQVFFEHLQLRNLRIFVYDLPTIFNVDQVTINELHPPKIWDPNCTANFYSAEYSLHGFLLKSEYLTLDPIEADFSTFFCAVAAF